MVRVDCWKASGKRYQTIALDWDRYSCDDGESNELIQDTFKRCLREQGHYSDDFIFTCLDPYHEFSYPIMIIGKNAVK